jgi:hypothetical protein
VIRVLIAEDMHMIRGALVALLSFEDDIEVVGELDRGDEVVPAALRMGPTWRSWTSTYPAWTASLRPSSCPAAAPWS